MEAEYISLSLAMRTFIPIRALLKEIVVVLDDKFKLVAATFKSTVFEDNMGALTLATKQRVGKNSKHYNIKLHHFWENVRSGDINIRHVATKNQRADYTTKGLPLVTFVEHRNHVQGW